MSKVYLGEDTPTQALFLRGALNREPGLEVTIFGDGLDLYLAILRDPPHLIISDNMLPTLGGLALARLIKFHEETQHIPFILISSMTQEQIGPLKMSGVDAYLVKPIRIPELKELIAKLFEGYRHTIDPSLSVLQK